MGGGKLSQNSKVSGSQNSPALFTLGWTAAGNNDRNNPNLGWEFMQLAILYERSLRI
jgi:hypothetical protein